MIISREFNKFNSYFAERFPLKIFGLYAASVYFISFSFGNHIAMSRDVNYVYFILGFIPVFLFFIQLRIFDEHKDFESDCIEHPQRMLSKGEITLGDLRKVVYPVIIMEFIINAFLGIKQSLFWCIIFIWSLLMLKEFFAPVFLKRHEFIYLFSHQLVISMICLYSLNVNADILSMDFIPFASILLFLCGCTCMTISMEMARKITIKPMQNGPDQFAGFLILSLSFPLSVIFSASGWILLMILSTGNHALTIFRIFSLILFLKYLYSAFVLFKNHDSDSILTFKQTSMRFTFSTLIIVGVIFFFP